MVGEDNTKLLTSSEVPITMSYRKKQCQAKLASIRHFLSFLKENSVIAGDPAETIKRAKKEEKESAVLY